jgi:hypothetical protein
MKISRKNWEASKEKWGDDSPIAKKIKNRKGFYNHKGWDNVNVSGWCGYCKDAFPDCASKCNLFPKICGEDDSLFEQFLECFLNEWDNIKPSPAFARAEKLRKRIYKAILADEPNVYEEE